jgi:membrane fusion protein (multidrug efflux system)
MVKFIQTMFSHFSRHARRLKLIYVIFITFFLLCAVYALWKHYQTYITTENAYVNANAVQIAAQVAGPVRTLAVENNQSVKKGALLFEIDPKLFATALEEASAQVSQAEAQFKNAKINFERIFDLVTQKFLPPEKKDNAQTALDVAAANLKLAQAKLEKAKLDLDYTRVMAPADGIINNLTLRPGTIVSAQIPLFVLIDNTKYWVDANFKETELEDIKAQQFAMIVLDMYPNQTFKGIVESISGSSGTVFSLLPPQNATGNWVKVTQRIPVKIRIQDPSALYPLRIGASATVTINITSQPIDNQ